MFYGKNCHVIIQILHHHYSNFRVSFATVMINLHFCGDVEIVGLVEDKFQGQEKTGSFPLLYTKWGFEDEDFQVILIADIYSGGPHDL